MPHGKARGSARKIPCHRSGWSNSTSWRMSKLSTRFRVADVDSSLIAAAPSANHASIATSNAVHRNLKLSRAKANKMNTAEKGRRRRAAWGNPAKTEAAAKIPEANEAARTRAGNFIRDE